MNLKNLSNEILSVFLLQNMLALIYFFLMIRFYLVDNVVFDYILYKYYSTLYYSSGKDAYSPFFFLISKFILNSIDSIYVAHVFSLIMLTSSMLLINVAGCRILQRENLFVRVFVSISTYVFGSWYYIYGKLYYDFPFVAFLFSISFFLSIYLMREDKRIIKSSQVIYLVFVLLGFTLSWKGYGIFPVIGLIAFYFVLKKELFYDKMVYVCFLLGFLFGWYSLAFNFIETVKEIRGYKASCGLQGMIKYLFSSSMKCSWDHVYLGSFSAGVFCFPSLFFLTIASFFIRFKFYIVFVIIFVMFCSFIVFGSPGYLWHGFPFSLFLILSIFFLLNIVTRKRKKFYFYY